MSEQSPHPALGAVEREGKAAAGDREQPGHPLFDAVQHQAYATGPGPLQRWLGQTTPAMLFLQGLGLLLLAGVAGVVAGFLGAPPDRSGFVPTSVSPPGPSPPRGLATIALMPIAFVAGAVGGRLPFWACARLIADALLDRPWGRDT